MKGISVEHNKYDSLPDFEILFSIAVEGVDKSSEESSEE
jgi:hypothetical protein